MTIPQRTRPGATAVEIQRLVESTGNTVAMVFADLCGLEDFLPKAPGAGAQRASTAVLKEWREVDVIFVRRLRMGNDAVEARLREISANLESHRDVFPRVKAIVFV